jgi:hypothetical protein
MVLNECCVDSLFGCMLRERFDAIKTTESYPCYLTNGITYYLPHFYSSRFNFLGLEGEKSFECRFLQVVQTWVSG